MNPCAPNRKLIAWLALNELDSDQAARLRSHLENCPGCQAYFQELSNVSRKLDLAQITPEVIATGSFHRRLVQNLSAEQPRSPWSVVSSLLTLPGWRIAVPACAGLVIAVAVLSEIKPSHTDYAASSPTTPVALTEEVQSEAQPTLSNYRMIANRSLDDLDEVITRQADQGGTRSPAYTVLSLAQMDVRTEY